MKESERLARLIVEEILRDSLPPGTCLPPEGSMLASYGVGRPTLREALRLLEVQGFLEIRPGRGGGPVVRQPNSEDFARMASLHYASRRFTVGETVIAGSTLEPVLTAIAARARTQSELKGMRVLVDQSAELVKSGASEAFSRAGYDFHVAVADASHSRVLTFLLGSFRHFDERELNPPTRATVEKWQVAHERILAAIIDRDADAAERLMRQHLRSTNFLMKYDQEVDWL
jgi:GntR family transcriptional regulator, transcriptional repressor for pyruvate dehydrogenase complex